MSFFARNSLDQEDDYRSRFSLNEDDHADQREEYQSTRSELPAEIPDSQPDPYLPAEIPDSQPEVVYYQDLPFGEPDFSEVSSQLPTRDHCDLDLGDASAFEPRDYDLSEEEVANSGDRNLDDHKDIDSRVNRFDRIHREEDKRSSSCDTEIIPGGTQITERLKDRIVSLQHHPPVPTTVLSTCLEISPPQ